MLIHTITVSATDTRGKRIYVKTVDDNHKAIVYSWNHALNADENHEAAAAELLNRLDLGHFSLGLAAVKSGDRYFVVEGEN